MCGRREKNCLSMSVVFDEKYAKLGALFNWIFLIVMTMVRPFQLNKE